MTISSQTNRWVYNGDGATVAFPFTNKIFTASDLVVTVGGAAQVLNTDYTVSGVGAESGGTVTFNSAPASGTGNVIIVRSVPYTQGTDIPLGGAFPASSVEDGLDKNAVLAQQVKDLADRSIRQPDSDSENIGALPAKASRAGQSLGFDNDGDPIVGPSLTTLALTYTEDEFTGDGSTTAFVLSATPGAQSLVEVFVDGVRQYPGVSNDYTLSGATVTFVSGAPANNAEIFVRHGQSYTGTPSDASVSEAKMADNAVDWPEHIKHQSAGDIPIYGASGAPALLSGVDGQSLGFASGVPALIAAAPPGFIKGCVPSSAADTDHDITFTAGQCVNAAGTKLLTLPALTKQFDVAFAEGGAAGGFGVALPVSGTYRIFAITKDADGTVDYFGDTAVAGNNVPAGWTVEREVFRLFTDGSSNIRAFSAWEKAGGALDIRYRQVQQGDTNAATTTSALRTVPVPTGKAFETFLQARGRRVAANLDYYITSPAVDDETIDVAGSIFRASTYFSGAGVTTTNFGGQYTVRTNTNAQVRVRSGTNNSDGVISVVGWIDERVG